MSATMDQAGANTAAAGTVDSVMRHRFVMALEGRPRKPRVRPMYLIMLALVAALMVLLPAIYVGLVGLTAFFLWWHAIYNVGVFGQTGARAALVAYVGPLLLGGVLLGFMIKPLFARRRPRLAPQAINPRDEPLIFAFVNKLCDLVGAPRPAAIHIDMQMNASAGFRGFLSGVLGGKLELTIGLPLMAALTLPQFTGVLAHEFGHFGQRSAMRLNYVISTINSWFARLVYERDSWDEFLKELIQEGGYGAMFGYVASMLVWLTRRILWLLMMTGHLFSSVLSRQMEYDADRYSAIVIGTEKTQEMLREIPVIGAAEQATYSDLTDALAEMHLPDNVPQLLANRVAELPQKARQELVKLATQEKTRWFESHPALADRVRALGHLQEPGIFAVEGPASALLMNYQSLSRLMTLEFYRWNLGGDLQRMKMVKVEQIETGREEQKQQSAALTTYLADLLHPLRPVGMPAGEVQAASGNAEISRWAEELLELRSKFAAGVEEAKRAATEWKKHDEELAENSKAGALASAGVHRGGADAVIAIQRKRNELEAARAEARKRVEATLTLGMRRMRVALNIVEAESKAQTPGSGGGTADIYDVSERIEDTTLGRRLAAWRMLTRAEACIEELRHLYYQQDALLAHAQTHGNDPHYVEAVLSRTRRQAEQLQSLRKMFMEVAYPYAEEGRAMSLNEYVLRVPVAPDDVGGAMSGSAGAISRILTLYLRLAGDVAQRCEAVEKELGLA